MPNGTIPSLVESTVITPTCDRPEAFRLCERWMARQTVQPSEWIVSDGGKTPAAPTMGQIHLHDASVPPGKENFVSNLLRAISQARGKLIVFVEDDDWYRADHLQQTFQRLARAPLVGGIWQPYYNLQQRVWRIFRNRGSSLCQTGMRRCLIPLFQGALQTCAMKGSYGVDGTFWDMAKARSVLTDEYDDRPVIGMKGLPGQVGLGVGHRPKPGWTEDPHWDSLRKWVGTDWEVYRDIYERGR